MNLDDIFATIKDLICAPFPIFFVIISIASWFFHTRKRRKHIFELKMLAAENGWQFYSEFDFPFLRELARFAGKVERGIFGESWDSPFLQKSRNAIQGNLGGGNFAVFEQRYYTGAGKYRTEWTMTVFAIELKDMNLPVFYLEPDSFDNFSMFPSDKKPDINFYHINPKFSGKYLLYGPDERRVRDLFSPSLLHFFEQIPFVRIIAGGRYLIIYEVSSKYGLSPHRTIENLNILDAVANAFKYRR